MHKSEVSTLTLADASKLGFTVQLLNTGTPKIEGPTLNPFSTVQLEDQVKDARSPFKSHFLQLCFWQKKEFTQMSYLAAKSLSIWINIFIKGLKAAPRTPRPRACLTRSSESLPLLEDMTENNKVIGDGAWLFDEPTNCVSKTMRFVQLSLSKCQFQER